MPCVSVWSASFRNPKHRPHVKQNRVKLLMCLPQNGQNIPRPQSMFGHHKLYLSHLLHNHNTNLPRSPTTTPFIASLPGVWYIPFPWRICHCKFVSGLVKVFCVLLICFLWQALLTFKTFFWLSINIISDSHNCNSDSHNYNSTSHNDN